MSLVEIKKLDYTVNGTGINRAFSTQENGANELFFFFFFSLLKVYQWAKELLFRNVVLVLNVIHITQFLANIS